MQRLPEGLQGVIKAPLQIRGKLRLMLVIGHLAVISEDAMEDLLGLEAFSTGFSA